MDPATNLGLSQIVITLITAVGVGNFILIMLALFIVVNAPTIINQLLKMRSDKEARKSSAESSNIIKAQLIDIKEYSRKSEETSQSVKTEVETLGTKVSDLKESTIKENEERREENILITKNLVKMSQALDSIDKMMRNVMSEKDTMEVIGLKMGIKSSFKNNLLARVMETIESLADKRDGQLSYDLKSDIESVWSDLKSEFENFNTPINIRSFLNDFDEELWSQGGMFTQIMNLAISNLEKDRKRDAISKQIDTGTRSLQSKISSYLELKRKERV
jgi:hypothetical protein